MPKGLKVGGRVKGTPNLLTRSMKECVQSTLEWLQTQPRSNMRTWANENPTAFYQIASKLIPTEIKGEVDVTILHLPSWIQDDKSNIESK